MVKRSRESDAEAESEAPDMGRRPRTNEDGEAFFELSDKRRVTVRAYQGRALVDIREFYPSEEKLKPGKKGIALTVEQWAVLRDHMEEIDAALANV